MKKALFIIAAMALVAGSCSVQKGPQSQTQTPSEPKTLESKVDRAVSEMVSGLDAEVQITNQSDEDLVNLDQQILNGYEGVSDASY